MTGALPGTVRELACLALGHDDGDEPRCPSTDEQLARQLVDEVQQLRVAAGIVEETETDRRERVEAVQDALDEVDDRQGGIHGEADLLVEVLAEAGWQLLQVRQP